MKIKKKQLLAIRCDICHQTDNWDIYKQKCSRCSNLDLIRDLDKSKKKVIESVEHIDSAKVNKTKIHIEIRNINSLLSDFSFMIIKISVKFLVPLLFLLFIISLILETIKTFFY